MPTVAELYEVEAPRMTAALRSRGALEPEDAVQAAWCKALKVREPRDLRLLTWHLLWHERANQFRKAARLVDVAVDDLTVAGRRFESAALARVFLASLALSDDERALLDALMDAEWAGSRLAVGTWDEIGTRLGIKPAAAKLRWQRLMARIRRGA